jgi:hypothetical protein
MPSVRQCFSHREDQGVIRSSPHLISNTRIGVEVELEGFLRDTPRVRGWNTIPDGSLRDGGLEFVFNGPVGGVTAMSRLTALGEALEPYQENIKCSERTSLHVHIDVRDLQLDQVWSMLVLYGLVEPYLFSVCGEHRADNIYSLAWYKGEGQIVALSSLHSNVNFGAVTDTNYFPKYSTVNIGALSTFGSLEFRGHEGTATIDEMVLWINHLLALKEYVLNDPLTPKGMLNRSLELGGEGFLTDVFGDLLVYPENIQDFEEGMDIGNSVATDLLFNQEIRFARDNFPDHYYSDNED